MHSTVIEICQNFISDKILKEYSYKGQGPKLKFKQYDNLTKVIVASTIESMKRKHHEIFGKDKIETDDEKKKLYGEIESYFTKEYIKKASSRFNRANKPTI